MLQDLPRQWVTSKHIAMESHQVIKDQYDRDPLSELKGLSAPTKTHLRTIIVRAREHKIPREEIVKVKLWKVVTFWSRAVTDPSAQTRYNHSNLEKDQLQTLKQYGAESGHRTVLLFRGLSWRLIASQKKKNEPVLKKLSSLHERGKLGAEVKGQIRTQFVSEIVLLQRTALEMPLSRNHRLFRMLGLSEI
jgi:hypothetical protein